MCRFIYKTEKQEKNFTPCQLFLLHWFLLIFTRLNLFRHVSYMTDIATHYIFLSSHATMGSYLSIVLEANLLNISQFHTPLDSTCPHPFFALPGVLHHLHNSTLLQVASRRLWLTKRRIGTLCTNMDVLNIWTGSNVCFE